MKKIITKRNVTNMAFDKNKYDINYKKDHFDRLYFVLPKGEKERIKECAEKVGLTTSEFVRQAIYDKMDNAE